MHQASRLLLWSGREPETGPHINVTQTAVSTGVKGTSTVLVRKGKFASNAARSGTCQQVLTELSL